MQQSLDELQAFLEEHQTAISEALLLETPDGSLIDLIRRLLDVSVKFKGEPNISYGCGTCLGLIGCTDSNKADSIREKRIQVILSNFAKADETVDFIMFMLETILVPAFQSTSNTRSQGFLMWAMQEFLKLCDIDRAAATKAAVAPSSGSQKKFGLLSESTRETLLPFTGSRYDVRPGAEHQPCQHPLLGSRALLHGEWLRTLLLDMLRCDPGDNIGLIFGICKRIILGQDLSIASFLLPYAALNLILSATETEKQQVLDEVLTVLSMPLKNDTVDTETLKLCSQNIFDILDYLSKWLQERRRQLDGQRALGKKDDRVVEVAVSQIANVEEVLNRIPPEMISKRSIECRSYARALFHWEQYIQITSKADDYDDKLHDENLHRLQTIYTEIDEPDGIEGISAQMHVLNIDQQIYEQQQAGKWSAVQGWYELQLDESPSDPAVQVNLLRCIRESGQYGEPIFDNTLLTLT